MGDLLKVQSCDVRPISLQHFEEAMDTVQPTVSPGELKRYIDWNTTFGTYKQLELEWNMMDMMNMMKNENDL